MMYTAMLLALLWSSGLLVGQAIGDWHRTAAERRELRTIVLERLGVEGRTLALT